jgi:hypothetical protein
MTLFAFPIGGIFIGGIRLSTDPDTYEHTNWPKRHSMHPSLGGGLTIQDFGTFKRDNELKLVGANGQFLDTATVQSLHTLYRTRGVSHAYTDFLGNAFTVFIVDFRPVIFRPGLYHWSMDLRCLNITTLFGQAYTGG